MRVIETILTVLIIVIAFSFTNIMATLPQSPRYEPSDLERLGYDALYNLDRQEILAKFVYSSNFTLLKSALMVCLPTDVNFNLTIFAVDDAGKLQKEGSIAYGDNTLFETSNFVSTVTYILAGSGTEYDPRILVLMLVRR